MRLFPERPRPATPRKSPIAYNQVMPLMEGTALLSALSPLSARSIDALHQLSFRAANLALFAPKNGLGHQMKTWFTDPFASVHHAFNWFDTLLLVPYFLVMIVLALYGVHRYTMCWHYWKFRKNYNPNPPKHFAELPRVTVQLPIFNEQFVIDRLIEAVCAMDYPRDRLDIQVLDDSTDETVQVASG